MIRLLQLLIFGHAHKWKTLKQTPLVRPEQVVYGQTYGQRTGTRYIQQCETCGLVTKRDLI
jgi:hypothetical protein